MPPAPTSTDCWTRSSPLPADAHHAGRLPRPTKQSEPTSLELQIGDSLTETGDWEIIGRPYTTAGGGRTRVFASRGSANLPSSSSDLGRARARQREAGGLRGGRLGFLTA